MAIARRIGHFVQAPMPRKFLIVEALWELARARMLTRRPASVYSSALGVRIEDDNNTDDSTAESLHDEVIGADVGEIVSAVARSVPFRALCLEQAIATRRVLARRGIPATVYLGIARDVTDRAPATDGRAAHAWVSVGSRVVSGAPGRERFAVVARFA